MRQIINHLSENLKSTVAIYIFYFCRFLLAAVSVPVIFFLLLGFLLLPFFMFLLFLFLGGSIIADYAVWVLAVVSFSVWVSHYITSLKRKQEANIIKNTSQNKNLEWDKFLNVQSSCVFLLWRVSPPCLSSLCPSSSSAVPSSCTEPLCLISLVLLLGRTQVRVIKSVKEWCLSGAGEQKSQNISWIGS